MRAPPKRLRAEKRQNVCYFHRSRSRTSLARRLPLLVPMLCVGTRSSTLRVDPMDAERPGPRPDAEHRDEDQDQGRRASSRPPRRGPPARAKSRAGPRFFVAHLTNMFARSITDAHTAASDAPAIRSPFSPCRLAARFLRPRLSSGAVSRRKHTASPAANKRATSQPARVGKGLGVAPRSTVGTSFSWSVGEVGRRCPRSSQAPSCTPARRTRLCAVVGDGQPPQRGARRLQRLHAAGG